MTAAGDLLTLLAVERAYRADDGGFTLRIPQLSIAAGERLVILGPSGSGKSTLLDLLAFLAGPTRAAQFTLRIGTAQHGTAQHGIAQHDIAAAWRGPAHRLVGLRARHVGYILQTGGLLPYATVMENILLSRRLLRLPGFGRLAALAETLGIATLLRRRPGELSVGQRQRVAVARALAHEPALVLADEPTAALDAGLALAVTDAMVATCAAMGAALVVVTHDHAIAARVGGRTLACRPDPADASATLEA